MLDDNNPQKKVIIESIFELLLLTYNVKIPIHYLFLTHSLMQLSLSWQSAICAVTQEIPNILLNPKVRVHYRVHKSPPIVYILSQINPIHTIQSYLRSIWIISCSSLLKFQCDLINSTLRTDVEVVELLFIQNKQERHSRLTISVQILRQNSFCSNALRLPITLLTLRSLLQRPPQVKSQGACDLIKCCKHGSNL
jgi:hypothetical protein